MDTNISRQLLCTFSDINTANDIIKNIQQNYIILNNKIFVFCNVNNECELYITYNVSSNKQLLGSKLPNTILIHRKKQTNTLYTLNAMNKLIQDDVGRLDKSYIVPWNLYTNSLIITSEVSVKIIPLKIKEVIHLK